MIGQRAFDIHDHGRKLVRRAVVLDGDLCNAIMDLAMGSQSAWSLLEANALNDELDACELTVAELVTKCAQDL